MLQLPPIPAWDGLHPLIVHFPIALLLVVPLFILIGALLPLRRGRPLLLSALLLMVLGTAGTYVAISTGEAAGELADRSPAINATIEQHEELAEQTRTLFTVLTAVFAVILLLPLAIRRPLPRAPQAVLSLAFLVFYAAGGVMLANTAHQGGRLVHELGVQALMPAPQGPPAVATLNGGERLSADRDQDDD